MPNLSNIVYKTSKVYTRLARDKKHRRRTYVHCAAYNPDIIKVYVIYIYIYFLEILSATELITLEKLKLLTVRFQVRFSY